MRKYLSLLLLGLAGPVLADPLPNTKPLTTEGDLARLMVDGIHKYLDRELAAAPAKREALWKGVDDKQIAAKRLRLQQILGVVDPRVEPRMWQALPLKEKPFEYRVGNCRITKIHWSTIAGMDAEGLWVDPGANPGAYMIAIPHADQTPEQVAGLVAGDAFGLRLAQRGCAVLIPTLINRDDKYSGNSRMNRWTNYPHREWIHRMSYEMGRTLTGYEVQKVLAAVDFFKKSDPNVPVGVIGYGDGGSIALYAAAIDERIDAVEVAGYFGARERLWEEPIDRNVWDRVREFGDAELAAMIAPRSLSIDTHATAPEWNGPVNRPGRAGAAPGKLTRRIDGALAELKRYQTLHSRLFGKESAIDFVTPIGDTVDIGLIATALKLPEIQGFAGQVGMPAGVPIDENRQKRQLDQMVSFTQNLWRNSEPVRKEYWKKANASSAEKWERSCEWYRNYFHEEIIGKLPEPNLPLNPRSRQIYDTPKWTGHEVVLDCYDDVFAYGILLLPKDLKPGEKRPVVVCQHGLEGRPTDVCNPKERTKYYASFGAQLADQGYIVFAPQNPYIFDTYFRQIMRKGNPLRLSLFSFIIRQHQRILDWLETHPNVDAKKIAFYGLSYGGKTAMRVPAVEKRYCLSICAGDFNEWVGKIVSTELPMSYMFTKEYDMLEYNLGHTFNYAEMANLIAPRPFMVERGHDDGVGIDEWIAYEYAKVRYLYANRLKLPENTAIEFRPGGHEIFLKGTLDFLDKHLKMKK